MPGSISYNKGKFAEQKAIAYLKNLGYFILKYRYKTLEGEIDIIASVESILVFCEVKFRNKPDKHSIEVQRKMQRFCLVASTFLERHPNFSNYNCRFDLILICRNQIEHMQNIWECS